MDMHAGKDPGDMMDVQRVVAETQFLGSPIRDFLGQVHKSGRLQEGFTVGLVARDADILAKFVTFSADRSHISIFCAAKLTLFAENVKFFGRI